jgi:hypothetical protein
VNVFLDSIEHAAREKFRVMSADADITAAANLAKTIAEAQKASIESQNQLRQLKMERLKSWSLLLVPIVSMLTLLTTVIIQAVQIRQQYIDTVHKTEDSAWSEFVSSLQGPAKNYASDITVSSRLRIFLSSDRHREQARDLAVRILGNLTNIGTFKELFAATLAEKTSGNFLTTIQVARSLAAAKIAIEGQCIDDARKANFRPDLPLGICTFALDAQGLAEFVKTTKDYSSAQQNKVALIGVMNELTLVSERISHELKQAAGADAPLIDMSYLFIQAGDFSSLDFSRIDFSNSSIAMSKLNGANITPKNGSPPELADSEWWNAAMIDGQLLNYLIENRYPYHLGAYQIFPSGKVDENDYRKRVADLCAAANVTCPPIKFGPQSGWPNALGPRTDLARPSTFDSGTKPEWPSGQSSRYTRSLRSCRSCASTDRVAIGRASSRRSEIGSPVSSQ